VKTYRLFTVRGCRLEDGISFDEGRLIFRPRWGIVDRGDVVMAAVNRPCNHLRRCNVALVDGFPVLVPVAPCKPDGELVLLQEYSPGCGAKRYPSFYVEHGNAEQILCTEATTGGSGYEKWSLLIAPMGWAINIASQFVDGRDRPSQRISYSGK